jgi:DNA-binding transcriptional ArsR family regulator
LVLVVGVIGLVASAAWVAFAFYVDAVLGDTYGSAPQDRAFLDMVRRSVILNRVLNQAQPLDLLFQALADPTRRVLVERLSRGPASVSALAEPLTMSLPGVMQHLQVLEASGLVRSEKVGRVRTCRIEPAALRQAEQWITKRRTSWERRLDRLGDFLAEPEDQRNDRRRP